MGKRIARWGIVVAGVLFLFAGLVRFLRTGTISAAFLVLAIALLVVGAIVAARLRRPASDRDSSRS